MSHIFENKRQLYLATSLIDCFEDCNLSDLKSLLQQKNADPNFLVPYHGVTPFHLLVGHENDEFAATATTFFLIHGGNPNVPCNDGMTPLHVAAAWGKGDILKQLINCGGDLFLTDHDNKTPLEFAIEEEHWEIVDYLRNAMNAYPSQDKSFISYNILQLDPTQAYEGDFASTSPCMEKKHPPDEYNNLNNSNKNRLICSTVSLLPTKHKRRSLQEKFIKIRNDISKSSADLIETNNLSHIIKDSVNETKLDASNCDNNSSDSLRKYLPGIESDLIQISETNSSNPQNITPNFHIQCTDYIESLLNQDRVSRGWESTESVAVICNNVLIETGLHYIDSSNNNRDSASFAECVNKSVELNKSEYKSCSSQSFVPNVSIDDQRITNLNDNIDVDNCSVITSDLTETSVPNLKYLPVPGKTLCEKKSNSIINLNQRISGIEQLMTDDTSLTPPAVPLRCDSMSNCAKAENCVLNEARFLESVNSNDTLVSVSEEYKYTDTEKGIVLIERRCLPVKCRPDEVPTRSPSPETTIPDYDTDTLRGELTACGFSPGPITKTTKRVYIKKLIDLHRTLPQLPVEQSKQKRVYTLELEKTLKNPDWPSDLSAYIALEQRIAEYFSNSDRRVKWRGGHSKSSFTYLLLDPRVTQNLPIRAASCPALDVWTTFLSAIFYVGKGKRSRPYHHLYQSVTVWNKGVDSFRDKKVQHILNIWKDQCGVVCLHIFQNVIPVEAHTREAAMIDVLGLPNLKNLKSGEYYGITMKWTRKQKQMLGVYLLYRALHIFLNEGERQLRPSDID